MADSRPPTKKLRQSLLSVASSSSQSSYVSVIAFRVVYNR